jgi:hypothetical protein
VVTAVYRSQGVIVKRPFVVTYQDIAPFGIYVDNHSGIQQYSHMTSCLRLLNTFNDDINFS